MDVETHNGRSRFEGSSDGTDGAITKKTESGGRNIEQAKRAMVHFDVTAPRSVHFGGRTHNGDMSAVHLKGNVELAFGSNTQTSVSCEIKNGSFEIDSSIEFAQSSKRR